MENKIRNSNIELLRILCIFFIIMHHSLFHSHINPNLNNINYCLLFGIQLLGKAANNVFILITGYYMVEKGINKKSLKKIIFETLFYSYVILMIYMLVTHNIDFNIILKSIVPLSISNNWFIIYYILLYISIPIINILILNLSKKQMRNVILALVIILSILPMIHLLEHAYSIYLWFLCLYMIGAYIKKYQLNIKYKKENKLLLIVSFISFYIFIALILKFNLSIEIMGEINNFIMLIMSVCILILFINKKAWYNKGVNYISSSVLGIYLIHDNFIIRRTLWEFFKIERYLPYSYFFVYEIGVILFVFCFCLLIDKVLETLVFKPVADKFFVDKNKKEELVKI